MTHKSTLKPVFKSKNMKDSLLEKQPTEFSIQYILRYANALEVKTSQNLNQVSWMLN